MGANAAETSAQANVVSSAAEAFARIAMAEALFASRADESGTHTKELSLWEAAGIEPAGPWYIETGQGMGETLTIASQKQAYTLSDRGSYLATENLDLEFTVADLTVIEKRLEKLKTQGRHGSQAERDVAAREELVERFLPLARDLAHQFDEMLSPAPPPVPPPAPP